MANRPYEKALDSGVSDDEMLYALYRVGGQTWKRAASDLYEAKKRGVVTQEEIDDVLGENDPLYRFDPVAVDGIRGG